MPLLPQHLGMGDGAANVLMIDPLVKDDGSGELLDELVGRLSAVSYFARLKAIAVNIFRAAAVRKALGLPGEAFSATKSGIRYAIFVFKEQFFKPMGLLASIFTPAAEQPYYELKIAA